MTRAPDGPAGEGPPAAGAGPAPEQDLQRLGYEQARAALEEVVRALELGSATLEESLALWERGEALARVCQAWLDGARARLESVRGAAPAAGGTGQGSAGGTGPGSAGGTGPDDAGGAGSADGGAGCDDAGGGTGGGTGTSAGARAAD